MYPYKYNYSILVSMNREKCKKKSKKKICCPFHNNEGKRIDYPDKLFVPINVFESITP